MAFASILGHERIKQVLSRALGAGRLPHALLFAGPNGVGKRALAGAVAQALLCGQGGGEGCGRCSPCTRVARGIHPDATVLVPEGASIRIDRVRDLVREISGRPFESKARAFVIDEAHLLTEEASNALLKSLEEPPPTSHVILVTASPQALLPTIRSRCQVLRFGPLPQGLLEDHLRQIAGLAPDEARLRASMAGGSLGAALAFESEAYRSLRDDLLRLLEGGGVKGGLDRIEAAQRLADLEDPALALTALRSLLRDAIFLRAGAPPERLVNADVTPRVLALAQGPLGLRAAALAEAAAEARAALRGNANRLLSMDLLVDALS